MTEYAAIDQELSEIKGDDIEPQLSSGDAIEKVGFGWFQTRMVLLFGPAFITDGAELVLVVFITLPITCLWGLSAVQKASLSTVVYVGMSLGSIFCGVCSDRYGRRPIFLVSTACVALFGLLSAISPNFYFFLICRTIIGFWIGGTHVPMATMVEYFPIRMRHYAIILGQSVWLTSGINLVCLLAWLVVPNAGWRLLLALTIIPSLVPVVLFRMVPESVRWLMTMGRQSQAQAQIQDMARLNRKPPPGPLLPVPETDRGDLRQFYSKSLFKSMVLLTIINFTNTFVYNGINLVSLVVLADNSNQISVRPRDDSGCPQMIASDYLGFLVSGSAEWLVLLINSVLLRYVGRKKVLASHFATCCVGFCFLLLCVMSSASRSLIVLVLFVMRGSIVGSLQVTYQYIPELLPTSVRSSGYGILQAFARFGGIVTPFVAQVLGGWDITFALPVYIVLLVICVVCALVLPKETSQRQIED
ncbi:hypothetical protein PROFUN_13581 [Planoprotostelium fungivorum]|uniref:Major facilitator superfamily (MFS) profile domain-containing protein n=1 Tax=Planoprotostelium fungivorum TaxID=1890364 RepID=A0A2P6N3K7_9EUKA|nr:hypothetical protein PROFUN_13581 [Planoprotostelium fungivorum]